MSMSLLGVNEGPTILGVSSESDFYAQSFGFSGGVFLVKEQPHQLRASTRVSVATELTNSDATTRLRQPQVNDIPLRLAYTPTLLTIGAGAPIKGAAAMFDPTLLGRGDHRTWGLVTGEVQFPTSSTSQGEGRILRTSLGLGGRQQIALLGADAPGLTHMIVGLGGAWSHNFHAAKTAVSGSAPSGPAGFPLGDQLSGNALIENQVGMSVSLLLSVVADLQLTTSFAFVHSVPYGFKGSGCEVETSTGCIDLPVTGAAARDHTSFDVGLSYLIVPELSVALGYENTAFTVNEAGQGRDPFYSSSALFHAGLSISFDRFYQRFAEPENLAALLGEKPAPATGGATGSR